MEVLTTKHENVICPYDGCQLNSLGEKYRRIGEEVIKKNKVCLIILGGGQGTRLRCNGPKGLFKIGGATLFDIHKERIEWINNFYGIQLSVLIMTSDFTHEETAKYFKDISWVRLFKQDSTYCKDENGSRIPYYNDFARAPNGNGGVFSAIRKVDVDGFEIINVISVDNVIANMVDPVAVGCLVENGYDVLSKSVSRLDEEETGVFVKAGNSIEICEYSELRAKVEGAQANILNHMFTTKFFKQMGRVILPHHKAHKKVPYTKDGILIVPDSPNGYKDEIFIFDSFRYASKVGVMVVPRSSEFSPLKNGMDKNSNNPEVCARDLLRLKKARKDRQPLDVVNI